MVKASLHLISLVAFALIISLMLSGTVSANLIGTNFGFPVLVHTSQTTVFSNDQAFSSDNEALNMDFPAFTGIISPASSSISGMDMGNDLFNNSMTTNFEQMGNLFDLNKFGLH